GQTWVSAAAVALDSVSFYLSALEVRAMSSATVCHRTGVDALRLIAAELADDQTVPKLAGERRLARADFDKMYDRLTMLGVKVKAERDTCWLRFVELRKEYETFLPKLAQSLLVPVHERLLLPLAAPARAAPADALASGNGDP